MLDKSLVYQNILMRHLPETPPPKLTVPPGFSLRFYQPGDETSWAEIETSVGEFASEQQALAYFKNRYLPEKEKLQQRCVFFCQNGAEPVATATAWYERLDKQFWPSLHWVAVKPAFQGLGLGKAVTACALRLLKQEHPGQAVYLHTQTWSHKAVGLYLKLGFETVKTETFAQYKNDYPLFLKTLQPVLPPEIYDRLAK